MLLCIEKPGSNSSGILIPPLGKLPFESQKKLKVPLFYPQQYVSKAVNLPKSMAVLPIIFQVYINIVVFPRIPGNDFRMKMQLWSFFIPLY